MTEPYKYNPMRKRTTIESACLFLGRAEFNKVIESIVRGDDDTLRMLAELDLRPVYRKSLVDYGLAQRAKQNTD